MRYVDGFVIAIPTKNLKAYKKMAKEGGKAWMKHGALEYMECVGDDLNSVAEWGGLPFPKMAQTKKGETVVFSFIVYKSRKHRDAVNKKVMKEMEKMYPDHEKTPMPFQMNRMASGGFKAIVDL